jgi:hypothetical protein
MLPSALRPPLPSASGLEAADLVAPLDAARCASVNHTVLPLDAGITPQASDIASTISSPRPDSSRAVGESGVGRPSPVSRTSMRTCPCE